MLNLAQTLTRPSSLGYETPTHPIDRDRLLTFGVGATPRGAQGYGKARLPPALINLLLLIWKFLIIEFFEAGTSKHKVDAEKIWTTAWRWFVTRVNARSHVEGNKLIQAMIRKTTYKNKSANKLLAPLASYSDHACITWNPHALRIIRELKLVNLARDTPTPP